MNDRPALVLRFLVLIVGRSVYDDERRASLLPVVQNERAEWVVHSTASREATERRRLHYIPSLLLCQSDLYVRSRCVEGAHTRIVCLVSRYAPCIVVQDANPPLSHTSTIGTMGIYISVNTRFILVQGESIHVWYACFSNMRKYTCILYAFVHRHDLRFRVSQEGATSKTNQQLVLEQLATFSASVAAQQCDTIHNHPLTKGDEGESHSRFRFLKSTPDLFPYNRQSLFI